MLINCSVFTLFELTSLVAIGWATYVMSTSVYWTKNSPPLHPVPVVSLWHHIYASLYLKQ